MTNYCRRCKKETQHRSVTERSQPSDPFTYYVCDDCGEPDLNYTSTPKKK